MIVWLVLGLIGLALCLLYAGIISAPITGLFVDVPSFISPVLSKAGDPYIIMTWIAIVLLAIVLIMKVGRNG